MVTPLSVMLDSRRSIDMLRMTAAVVDSAPPTQEECK